MPVPITAVLPHVRRFAVGFGPLLAMACFVVFAAGALAQGEPPATGQRSDPIAVSSQPPPGVASQGSPAPAPRPAAGGTKTAPAAQGDVAPSAVDDEELRLFFLLLLALFALRPVVTLVLAMLRRGCERCD